MAIIPFATKRLIPPGSNDPRIKARIGILHVDAGNVYDLYDYFAHRSGGIESHGHVARDGKAFQYRDTAYQADANLDANDFALSFETQGYGDGEWTDAQLETIKRIMLWARDAHGIPLRKVTSWNDARGGWGYHTLFGAPSHWTPVAKSCPGPKRKVQFDRVLVPWMNSNPTTANPPEDDMPFTPDQIKDLVREANDDLLGNHVHVPKGHPGDNPKKDATVRRALEVILEEQVAAKARQEQIIELLGKEAGQQ